MLFAKLLFVGLSLLLQSRLFAEKKPAPAGQSSPPREIAAPPADSGTVATAPAVKIPPGAD